MDKETEKPETSKELGGRVDSVVMCQWHSCNEPAAVNLVRANTCLCDKHHTENILQFACVFTTEPVNIASA